MHVELEILDVLVQGEVWLDLDRVGQIPELDGIIERLTNGDPVELSTGFRAFIKNVRGEFKGEVYERSDCVRPIIT